MKKFISLLLVIIMVSAMALCVAAADPKKTIYDSYKANFPANYQPAFDATVQSVLNQVPVTEQQAAEVVKLIEEGKAFFKTDKGISLSDYTTEEQRKATDIVNRGAKALGVTAKFVPSSSPAHKGDTVIEIYYNNKLIVAVDNEAVKVTGGTETTGYAPIAIALIVASMGLASVVTLKKRVF